MSVNDQKKLKAVARGFIKQYYLKLFESPSAPLSFYSEESNFFHAHNLESGESVTGSQKIGECLAKLAYNGGSVDLQYGSFDIQPSANEGFILVVTGLFKCRADSEPHQFTHTFFLAKNIKGNVSSLFVLNDCLRFLSHSSVHEEHQTKSPEFVAEESKQNDQVQVKQNVSVQKQEQPEIVEVHKPQQPEVVVPEKKPEVVEPKIETVVNTVTQVVTQTVDGWGEQTVEEDDDENDSDYVDEEEQDEDEDEELFDDNEPENENGSAIDFVDQDEVVPRRTEGKWVPKKKPEEGSSQKVAVSSTETKKEEPTQTQSSSAHHQHHHVHKHVEPVTQTEQPESETRKPLKGFSYAIIASKNTSQASNTAPTNIKKKSAPTPTTTTTTSATPVPTPVNTNAKVSPQTQQTLANLYIGNLTEEVTEDQLRDTFSSYGPIKKVTLKSGIAFIEFNSNSVVPTIIEDGKQHPFLVNEKPVKVDYTRPMTQTKNQNGGPRGTGRGGGSSNNNSSNNFPRQNNKTKK